MVMEGDSGSKGCWFESQHHVLDGQLSHLFVVRIVMFFEMTKINEKEPEDDPFLTLSVTKNSL